MTFGLELICIPTMPNGTHQLSQATSVPCPKLTSCRSHKKKLHGTRDYLVFAGICGRYVVMNLKGKLWHPRIAMLSIKSLVCLQASSTCHSCLCCTARSLCIVGIHAAYRVPNSCNKSVVFIFFS